MDSTVRNSGQVPRQVTLAALASIYGASESGIRRQLRTQGCAAVIENVIEIDTHSLYRTLLRHQKNIYDLTDDAHWTIATPAMLSRVTDLPQEIVDESEFIARLPSPVLIAGKNSWRYPGLVDSLQSDPEWATQWSFCEELGLGRSQLGWLVVHGALPMAYLGGRAIPGWPTVYFEHSRCMRFIDKFLQVGIPELESGELLGLDAIFSCHTISRKEIFGLILRDQMMCPLYDSAGNMGWPREYVQGIADLKATWQAGGNIVNRAGEAGLSIELAWEVFFLVSPDTAWREYENLRCRSNPT